MLERVSVGFSEEQAEATQPNCQDEYCQHCLLNTDFLILLLRDDVL